MSTIWIVAIVIWTSLTALWLVFNHGGHKKPTPAVPRKFDLAERRSLVIAVLHDEGIGRKADMRDEAR